MHKVNDLTVPSAPRSPPARREQEHRSEGMDFTSIEKIGNVTTRDAAGDWEEERIKHYMSQHSGRRPRYNQNDTGE